MEITKEQLEEELVSIDKSIQNNLGDEVCEKYIQIVKNIEKEDDQTSDYVKSELYASFAYFLFRVSEYEECLNMFIKAQSYGYSKDEIKKVIWEAFVQPNLEEFKVIYNKNVNFLLLSGYILEKVEFDDLDFWLIPTNTKNEFYIYDKREELIKEKFVFNSQSTVSLPKVTDEFSDFLVLEEWNWNKIKSYTDLIGNYQKKAYIVVKDIKKLFACLQAELLSKGQIANLLIFDGFSNMKEHFISGNEYLPRNIIDLMSCNMEAKNIIDQIHMYRVSNNASKRENILLSICIPSYNRGRRAYDNIIHNLQSYYDEEIEIVLSNNGTQNSTKEYYEKISLIKDSRLTYYAFEENEGFALNICKTSEIARGKFILMLSDEDLVNLSALPKIMDDIYKKRENLAVMRTRGDRQAIIPSTKFTEAGEEAILTYSLTSNYISGIIYNNTMIKKYNCRKYIKDNIKNAVCFYYPHMEWELILCQYGNVLGKNIILINEGKAEKMEDVKEEIGMNIHSNVPYYASIDGRLDQHKGFYNIFIDMEICKGNFDVFRKMYIKLCGKTIFLVHLSISVFYKNMDISILSIIDKLYLYCVKYLNECYGINRKKYVRWYAEDLKLIAVNCDLLRDKYIK